MDEEQFKALIDYIDAAIQQAIDDRQSSDEGLCTSIYKSKAEDRLHRLLVKDN